MKFFVALALIFSAAVALVAPGAYLIESVANTHILPLPPATALLTAATTSGGAVTTTSVTLTNLLTFIENIASAPTELVWTVVPNLSLDGTVSISNEAVTVPPTVLYLAPGTGDTVVVSATAFYWNVTADGLVSQRITTGGDAVTAAIGSSAVTLATISGVTGDGQAFNFL